MTSDTTPVKALRFLVSGRVQGVYFRASTRQQARQLSLTGYARNLPDGRVEVLAVGKPDALNTLNQWLWRGPPAANVTDVQTVDVELEISEYVEFETL